MARWIGAVGCLLLVGVAAAQLVEHPNLAGHPSEVPPSAYQEVVPPPTFLDVSLVPAPPTTQYTTTVQAVPVVAQEPAYPTPTPLNNGNTRVFVTDPAGNPVSPSGPYAAPVYRYDTPPAQEVSAVAPYPVYPATVAPPEVSYAPQPVAAEAPLITEVYSVADLVVGHSSGPDPNQALISMLAQQSEELAMTLNAAGAGAAGPQQDIALTELAATIESAFEHEFENGHGSITLHRGTFSLIVRQTENVHVQIRDLLDQLRNVNDTEISITIELVEMDEARSAFAFAHNGQVLDESEAAEFRALAEQGEAEKLTFSVTSRNGESTSMPAYGLPGTLTAVASHDHSEVRVLLDMFWGLEMGMTQKHNHRIPAGETILTIFTVEDSGYVVLLSAEIETQEELEDALFGPEDATLLPATHAEPAPPAEPVSQTRRPLIQTQTAWAELDSLTEPAPPSEFVSLVPRPPIMTQTLLVEVDSLSENYLEQLLERFDGEILPECEPHAAVLQSATGNDVVLAMQEDHADMRIIHKPQTSGCRDGGERSLHVGRDVPVIYGIAFEGDVIVPLARHQDIGTWLNLVSTVTDDGSIESRAEATRKKVLDEEVVVYSSPDQTITSPVIGSVTASTTFTVPQGKTVVWPVPPIGGPESDGPTLLIFLTSQVRGDADHAE